MRVPERRLRYDARFPPALSWLALEQLTGRASPSERDANRPGASLRFHAGEALQALEPLRAGPTVRPRPGVGPRPPA